MRLMLSALLIFSLTACAGVGYLTPNRNYATSDTMTISQRPDAFISQVSEVGQTLGYEISGTHGDTNQVILSDNAAGLGATVLGKMQVVLIYVQLKPDRRTIGFNVQANGNMSSVSQKKIEKRLEELKAALRQRFSER